MTSQSAFNYLTPSWWPRYSIAVRALLQYIANRYEKSLATFEPNFKEVTYDVARVTYLARPTTLRLLA